MDIPRPTTPARGSLHPKDGDRGDHWGSERLGGSEGQCWSPVEQAPPSAGGHLGPLPGSSKVETHGPESTVTRAEVPGQDRVQEVHSHVGEGVYTTSVEHEAAAALNQGITDGHSDAERGVPCADLECGDLVHLRTAPEY